MQSRFDSALSAVCRPDNNFVPVCFVCLFFRDCDPIRQLPLHAIPLIISFQHVDATDLVAEVRGGGDVPIGEVSELALSEVKGVDPTTLEFLCLHCCTSPNVLHGVFHSSKGTSV